METPTFVEIYTETTPNPESLKFVMNRILLQNDQVDYREESEASESPLALKLFKKDNVHGVFIAQNFVTITKDPSNDWYEIIPEIKAELKEFIQSGDSIFSPEFLENRKKPASTEHLTGIEEKIKELLDTYVKPAVSQDGGNIEFQSFQNGTVTVMMQGSCSGCPSSMVTLKSGIEGLLKRMVPEVQDVVAVEMD